MKAALAILVLAVVFTSPAFSQRAKASACPDPLQTPTAPHAPTMRLTDELRERLFDGVHDAIKNYYPAMDFYGVDWLGLREGFLARVRDAATDQEVYAVLEEMVGLLRDNVSDFISADEVRADEAALAVPDGETYGGVGLRLGEAPLSGPVAVDGIFPGSPAAAAGIRTGDRILAVDGDPCPHIMKIRGAVGSEVTLTVRSPGEPPREVTVRRASIMAGISPLPSPVRHRRVAASPGIGYVSLPSFEAELDPADRFAEALRQLLAGPALRGLILDLRDAGFGDYGEAERIAGMLGSVGRIGAFERRFAGTGLVAKADPIAARLEQVPLAILVGEQTADIAELLAARLQQQGTVLVGRPTSGTVWGADERELADGSFIVFPIDQTVLPDGTRLGRRGVMPDVVVKEDWFEFSEEEDPYVRAAVATLRTRKP